MLYICDICEKTFSKANELKSHVNMAHKKIHKCDYCGIKVSNGGNLKIHIRAIHEGHKGHKCNICGKLFALQHQLKGHSAKKKYKCETCEISFCYGTDLQ